MRRLLSLALLLVVACTAPQHPRITGKASYQGAGLPSTLSTYLLRGQTLAGLSADAAFQWDDFDHSVASVTPGWIFGSTGSGGGNPQASGTGPGGVYRLSTGTTAASTALLDNRSNNLAPAGTGRGYFAARFAVSGAVDAQAACTVGPENVASNRTLAAGFVGPLNAANFVVQYDSLVPAGSALNLGVAVDTAMHVYEIYWRGDTVLRARIDGGAEATATMVSAPTDPSYVLLRAANGTTAANRQLDVDWVLTASTRQ